jgi:ribonuclease G
MSKEMIISVNGREKKIAILDNGQVTEFYIERGEENSGVVGNIYKGRVQRVMPGMQSAFVEIGLERDAFLYVSDFFDEEEEIERIVMEKTKKSSPDDAEREATDFIHKERLKREQQIEEVQEIVEPLVESGTEIEIEVPEEEIAAEDAEPKEKRGKSRRDRRKNKREEAAPREEISETVEAISDRQLPEERQEEEFQYFEVEESNFERIIDDEDTGEMFKDAYMQEAIFDKVRAVEFDMESTSSAEVGSLISAVADAPNGFERVADEDETTEEKSKKRSSSRKSSKKSAAASGEEIDSAESRKSAKSGKKADGETKANPAGRKSSRKPAKTAEETANEVETEPAGETAQKSKRSKSGKSGRKGKKSDNNETLENAEAGIKEQAAAAEMAVRRGGRGRRGKKKPGKDDRHESADGGGEKNFAGDEPANDDYRSSNGSGSRRERSQPTITDLLREGQEILVQIAKEPIARKGARITSHIALPGRFLVYMPTIEHLGVSRKIESSAERARLRKLIQNIRGEEDIPSGGFIVRTAGTGVPEEELRQDARYLVRTWQDVKKAAEKSKSPALVHQDLDLIQRLLRDQLSDEFTAIRVDSEEEYLRIVEFVNRIQPRMVNRVKLYTRETPILDNYGVQEEIDKALKPRVWLKSGGYLVINQTEALVAIDVNTGKFVGKGNARLEDTITRTNMEAVQEIARQIRLRDLGGIIVLDLIDMEDRRNRHKVQQTLQEALSSDKSPTKVLSFNDFGLIIMTRKRVKQSLERTMCAPCENCEGSGWVKSPQTICYEILEEARRLSKTLDDVRRTTIRVHPEVAKALRESERTVLEEVEAYLGDVDLTGDGSIHQEQFDFAFI